MKLRIGFSALKKKKDLAVTRLFRREFRVEKVEFGSLLVSKGRVERPPALEPFGKQARRDSSQPSANIVHSPLGQIVIPNVAFHELIFQNWSLWNRKTAIVCGATGRKYTFKTVMSYSKNLATSLQNKLKLKKGDFLAVILPNCPEYPIIILACSMTGVIPTTTNPLYTVDEIKSQLSDCGVKAVVTDQAGHQKCTDVVAAMKVDVPIVVVETESNVRLSENAIDFLQLCRSSSYDNFTPVAINPDDTLILPFSSGTTGAPKGVILSHKNLVANLTQISHPETLIINPTTRFQQDTVFGILPMFHIYGLVIVTFYSLRHGCRLIVLPRFDPRLYMMNVVRKKANILYVVPPLLKFLSHDKVLAKYFKNLKFIINAAAPMALDSAYRILEKAPHVKIAQGYGMTESSPALAHTSTKRMQKLTTIGIPIASTKLKITSLETGEALPRGKQGELCAWGPQVMQGYWNRAEETLNAFDRDGWLRTGDIAYYDEDGDFFVVDRLKSLIKVKGFQVAPAELEEVLLTHPEILEAVVVGIKNEEFGEVPRAFLVVRKGARVTEEDIKEFVKHKLSSYKQLRGGVRFLQELPKNNVGKIIRKELENMD